jgi:citrate lyase beta subunit
MPDVAANRERFLARMQLVYQEALHARAMGIAGKWVGHPAHVVAVLLAFERAQDEDVLEREIERLAADARSVQEEGPDVRVIDGAMADRATDRHARIPVRRAVTLGQLDAQLALALGLIEPHELQAAQAIWRR